MTTVRFSRMFTMAIVVLLMAILCGCEINSESDGTGDNNGSSGSGDLSFIVWQGSSNGSVVLDATSDQFQFLSSTGQMYFGSTTITNVRVGSDASLYFNDVIIGAVVYVQSSSGSTITGMVANSGYLIDFYGPESSLTWTESSISPVYAKRMTGPAVEDAPDGVSVDRQTESISEIFYSGTFVDNSPNAYPGDYTERGKAEACHAE